MSLLISLAKLLIQKTNMKTRPTIFLILLLCLMILPVQAQNAVTSDAPEHAEPPTIQAASETLDKLLALKAKSYHIFLSESFWLVPPRLKGLEWVEVQDLMKKRAFPVVDSESSQYRGFSKHLIKKNGFTFQRGQTLVVSLNCLDGLPSKILLVI